MEPSDPCTFSDNKTISEIQDQESSTSVVIAVVIIMVVFITILIGIVCLYRFRQGQNRQATAAHESSVVMIPSAPPLASRPAAPHYERNPHYPYSEVQTDDSRDHPSEQRASNSPGNDTLSPPPSYEEVISSQKDLKSC